MNVHISGTTCVKKIIKIVCMTVYLDETNYWVAWVLEVLQRRL